MTEYNALFKNLSQVLSDTSTSEDQWFPLCKMLPPKWWWTFLRNESKMQRSTKKKNQDLKLLEFKQTIEKVLLKQIPTALCVWLRIVDNLQKSTAFSILNSAVASQHQWQRWKLLRTWEKNGILMMHFLQHQTKLALFLEENWWMIRNIGNLRTERKRLNEFKTKS